MAGWSVPGSAFSRPDDLSQSPREAASDCRGSILGVAVWYFLSWLKRHARVCGGRTTKGPAIWGASGMPDSVGASCFRKLIGT